MFPRMQRVLISLALVLPASLHAADYTYQQTTQLTGGSMLQMMKSVGVFSSQARHIGDPVISTIYLKDNRLANVSSDSIEIIDLDKETVTRIDIPKKTYTVMTFAQMKQAMENARAQMQQAAAQQPSRPQAASPAAQNVKLTFDAKVRNTGVQKQISGIDSSEAILTLTLNATDTQTQQQGSMALTNDMWMVSEIPGYDQVRDFYMRFGEKMSDGTVGLGVDYSRMFAQNPGAGQAVSQMAEEMRKLKGVPIMQIMRVGTTTNGQPLPAASEAPLPPDNSPAAPTAGQVAKAGMGSMISSRLGGFGFGKKKSQDPPPDQNANAAQAQPTNSILMETQTTTSSFSSAPVDPSHFDIPAGYKQVEAPALTSGTPNPSTGSAK